MCTTQGKSFAKSPSNKELAFQWIGDEAATLLYQGQKLDFKFSKAGADKCDKGGKDASKK
jgi:hypothetical protein